MSASPAPNISASQSKKRKQHPSESPSSAANPCTTRSPAASAASALNATLSAHSSTATHPHANIAAASAPTSAPQSKRQKLFNSLRVSAGLGAIVTPAAASAHPFDSDPHDHCETPIEAFRDLEPFLFYLARALGKDKRRLKIYDPYYCERSCVTLLGRLGFESVINVNEDFYAVIRENRVPEHDVIVTNPPFSGGHLPAILDFVTRRNKPWFLLMPGFVWKKPYFTEAMKKSASAAGASSPPITPFYIGPSTRPYQFSAPGRDLGGVQPLVHRSSESLLPFQVFAAKFETVWFAHMGETHTAPALAWWGKKFSLAAKCVVSQDPRALPQLIEPPPRVAAAAASRPWRKKLSRQRKKQQQQPGKPDTSTE